MAVMGERLDESVVGRLPRAGEVQRDAALIGPDVEIARHELGAVVGNDRGFAPSGDDRREFTRDPLSGDRRVRDCAQTFLGDVVDDVQDTEEPLANWSILIAARSCASRPKFYQEL